jgi:hypothetical protein
MRVYTTSQELIPTRQVKHTLDKNNEEDAVYDA